MWHSTSRILHSVSDSAVQRVALSVQSLVLMVQVSFTGFGRASLSGCAWLME